MRKRNNIVQFTDLQFNKINHENILIDDDKEEEDKRQFTKPTTEELQFFRDRARSYGDDMVPVTHWDGECWRGFLEKGLCEIMAHGDINLAWDYLAIFIYNEFKNVYLQGFEDGGEYGDDYQ